ncbi:g3241 [Coccomyxa elongata]
MGTRGLTTQQVVGSNNGALKQSRRVFVGAQKVSFCPKTSSHVSWSRGYRTRDLRICASSAEAEADSLAQQAARSVPHIESDDRIVLWGEDKRGVRHWLQRTVKNLTKKAWIAALALFYLYNEAVVKLPWVRIKRFENWFWTTVRCRWLHASNAATVLGRKWWKDNCGNFSLRNTTEGMARKRAEMELEMEEQVEHVKEDIEESMEHQKEAVNNNVPAPINPLLIKENLQKRLQSGLESSGLGNHAEEAMSRLRNAVPLLKSKNTQAEALAEAETQLKREAEVAEQAANASATATAPGVVDMPAALTKIELPSVDPAEISSFKDSAMPEGNKKGDQEAPHLARSWLSLFNGKGDGKDGGAEKQQEEVESNGRSWPLPLLFWKQ